MSARCVAPLPLDLLLAYRAGELDAAREAGVEAHYFGCDACARRLEVVERLSAAVAAQVRAGAVTSPVSATLIARAERDGLRIRSYRLGPGEEVACTVAPDDDFVAIRLRVPEPPSGRVDVAMRWTHLDTGESDEVALEDVVVDRASGELILLSAADVVRTYPRSRWRMDVRSGDDTLGVYRLDHTPWGS